MKPVTLSTLRVASRLLSTVLASAALALGCQDHSAPTSAVPDGPRFVVSDPRFLLPNDWGATAGYKLIRLNIGGLESYAVDINNDDAVAGGAYRDGTFEAFVWKDGAVEFLGTLGGDFSFAFAINDGGAVTGVSSTAAGEYHAFIWTPERGMEDIGAGEGWGINQDEVVVGFSGSTAFRWTAATGMVELPALPGGYDSFAFDINGAGIAVGSSADATGRHAVRWDAGNVPEDLGTLGGYYSQARAIADNGTIVGTSSTEAYLKSFRWTPSAGMEPLSGPGVAGEAVGVSAAGAVGGSFRFNPPPRRPGTVPPNYETQCLWPPNGGCRPIANFNGALSALNDSGVITGVVSTQGPYGFEAVIWRPRAVQP
jgi:probable HAF family extracellular repeat protein